MRVRGVVREGSGGGVGVRGSSAWVMSVRLRPWRVVGGPANESHLLLWRWCADDDALQTARREIPAASSVLEIEAATPERIRGLEFRERGEHEVELATWVGQVEDAELQALAAALAPPDTIVVPAVGELRWDERLSRYHVARSGPAGAYEFAVEVDEDDTPEGFERAAQAVLAFESRFATLRLAVARAVYPLWRDDWRDDDDPVVPLEAWAERLPLSGLTADTNGHLLVAYFGDAGMFGRHSIEVRFDDDGNVRDADLVG